MKIFFMERVHKTYVLSKKNKIIATFGNLRKVVNFIRKKDKFPSYWTIIRENKNLYEYGNYSILRVKHY
jgi:hypothetical protein